MKRIKTTYLAACLAALLLLIAACSVDTTAPGTPSNPTAATVTPRPTTNAPTSIPANSAGLSTFTLPYGYGATKSFWQVYFTHTVPSGSAIPTSGGIDEVLAKAIDGLSHTLDIAAYEFNDPPITAAVLRAKQRGVTVRVVTDDDAGIGDKETTLHQLVNAGITVVADNRSALMHNKFMILDSTVVWTGTWNYTVNGTFRNSNNAVVLNSQPAVQDYQAEFNEMFVDKKFGPSSPANTPRPEFTQDGVTIGIYFSPEDDPLSQIAQRVSAAQHTVRFMTFSFTEDSIGQALISRAAAGVDVQGIFEKTGSETKYSEMTPLFCAGLPVRQDGNPYILHHKVFIIDGTTVLTGSFNISNNATTSNDENLVSITDPDLAAQFQAEFDRQWAVATAPTGLTCP